MKLFLTCFLFIATFGLTSCGTVAPVKMTDSATNPALAGGKTFQRVLIKDFRNLADTSNAAANAAGQALASKIQAEILRQRTSAIIARTGAADSQTLVVEGEIKRFVEGNAALRLFIGMGAGSSYFDAEIRLTDSKGLPITRIVADKNSWGLGGGIAAGQTVDSFMNEAARKTAEQVLPLLK